MLNHKNLNEIIVFGYIVILLIIGLAMQNLNELSSGLVKIFVSPGVLISDYMVIGGIGPAIVNASIVALIGLALTMINNVPMNGLSVATVFTMFGFGLFGKNIWSIFPVIFGAYLYSKLRGKKFKDVIYAALFGTALAPLVTQAAFGFNMGIIGGCLMGIIAGLMIPPLATQLVNLHQGFNLYNIGFTAGITGMIFMSILKGYGLKSESVNIWGTEFDYVLRLIVIPIFLSMIVLGLILASSNLKEYKKILRPSVPSYYDFVREAGFGNTLINMGLVGLIGVIYIELVGGSYNGPTLGGLFTLIGFAAYGKHPLNIIPIMAGVWLGTAFSTFEANAPGPLLAALFGTTLAPLSGRFGPLVGVLAGFIHLSFVTSVGSLHGAMNLYNNGFSGGLVATIIVAFKDALDKK